MKFRIIRYYDRYKAQVFVDKDKDYIDIGSPTGYRDVYEAEDYCRMYKATKEEKIVKEFEL